MKRTLTILSLVTLLMAPAAFAQTETYGWSLSASDADPAVNTAAPVFGLSNVYVWLACTRDDGMSAMEATVTGSLLATGYTPVLGLNAGDAVNLLLAVGGCPAGPSLVGVLTVADFTGAGGNLCLTGANVTVDCDTVAPQAWPHAVVGFASDGSQPCVTGDCITDSVEDASWGSIKGLYR